MVNSDNQQQIIDVLSWIQVMSALVFKKTAQYLLLVVF